MAAISVKLQMDSSQFVRTAAKALAIGKGLATSFTGAIGSGISSAFSKLRVAVPLAGAALAAGTVHAYNFGGEMVDLSARTGIAVDKLVVMQQALKDSGNEIESLVPALSKMSKALVAGEQGGSVKAFEQIGLHVKDLIALDPADQFERIGAAINALQSPMAKMVAAREIFGKAGVNLLSFFSDAEAMQNARDSIGKQAQLLGKNAEVFDRISDRLGRVFVKIRGFFVGVAASLAPVVDKFSAIFDKRDFSGWGQAIGDAIKTGMTWLVVFWENPSDTIDYFWEYAKGKTMEFGNYLFDAVDKAFPGIPGMMSDLIDKTKAWGEIIGGYALHFGQVMLAGVQTFIAAFKDGWEATGMPEVMRWIQSRGKAFNDSDPKAWGGEAITEGAGIQLRDVLSGSGDFLPKNWDNRTKGERVMQDMVNKWGAAAKASDPTSFANILKKIQGPGGGGAALTAKGFADLSQAQIPTAWIIGKDHTGAGAQMAKAAAMRKKLEPQIAKAQEAIGMAVPNMISEFISQFQRGHSGQNRRGVLRGAMTPMGASLAGSAWHDLSRGGYGGSPALSETARRQIIRANESADQIKARHALGNFAAGDAARLKKIEKEAARKAAGQLTDNEALVSSAKSLKNIERELVD